MHDRLYRSPSDRVVSGVAGGLAVWLNLDPSIVRVAWVILSVMSGGVFVLVYLVMMVVVPQPPRGWVPQPRDGGPAGGPWPAAGSGPGAASANEPPQWTTVPTPAASPAWSNAPGIVFGIILILVGAWFLVRRYVNIDWDVVWPFIVIGVGLLLILTAAARGRRQG